MEIVRAAAESASPIGSRSFEVLGVSSLELAAGSGDAHAYVLRFDADGVIGPHEAGFGQLLLAVSGEGWVAGEDGVRQPLREGDVAFIRRGEIHSKGSDTGLVALMIQVRDLALHPR